MKYPILITTTKRNTVIAVCPLMHDFYAEGADTEDALRKLRDKFLCYIHDGEVQLEIMTAKDRSLRTEDRRQMTENR